MEGLRNYLAGILGRSMAELILANKEEALVSKVTIMNDEELK